MKFGTGVRWKTDLYLGIIFMGAGALLRDSLLGGLSSALGLVMLIFGAVEYKRRNKSIQPTQVSSETNEAIKQKG